MKSIGELMQELGWDSENTQATAEAFLKHLNKAANESTKPVAMKPRQIKVQQVKHLNNLVLTLMIKI